VSGTSIASAVTLAANVRSAVREVTVATVPAGRTDRQT